MEQLEHVDSVEASVSEQLLIGVTSAIKAPPEVELSEVSSRWLGVMRSQKEQLQSSYRAAPPQVCWHHLNLVTLSFWIWIWLSRSQQFEHHHHFVEYLDPQWKPRGPPLFRFTKTIAYNVQCVIVHSMLYNTVQLYAYNTTHTMFTNTVQYKTIQYIHVCQYCTMFIQYLN